jgi:hypothetical protein
VGRFKTRFSSVPWWLPDSDLRTANHGEAELRRDLVRNGKPERQLGLHVWGQADAAPSLGVIALRCERHGERLVPLTLSIAETPIMFERKPVAVLVTLQSNPRRLIQKDDV